MVLGHDVFCMEKVVEASLPFFITLFRCIFPLPALSTRLLPSRCGCWNCIGSHHWRSSHLIYTHLTVAGVSFFLFSL
ncbi:hypothetical protein M440DRAFT_104874 [Trichoderma longibrachiatum ATCC 18648]|uniref:Uncharacterized protein n=1 Tax=Trichoderma longibrachiatum ATCC 18648 TaxID=983965 RepID=A0A2T4BZU5_TRILO|nr:hypothetical protein M440DRAFT_104874 [Trichoderma longibrachiatum ATCC 18648]